MEEECGICLEGIAAEDAGRPDACTHVFHAKCLKEWAAICAKCPLCKRDFAGIQRRDGVEAVPRSEEEACLVCEGGGEVVICDGCERVAHLACVGLRRVPRGEWFCRACAESRQSATARRAAREAVVSWELSRDDYLRVARRYLGEAEPVATAEAIPQTRGGGTNAARRTMVRRRAVRDFAARFEAAVEQDARRASRGYPTFSVAAAATACSRLPPDVGGRVAAQLLRSPVTRRVVGSQSRDADLVLHFLAQAAPHVPDPDLKRHFAANVLGPRHALAPAFLVGNHRNKRPAQQQQQPRDAAATPRRRQRRTEDSPLLRLLRDGG
ncbi:hypothetical protein CTAYLR_005671 [Chrysophaeum taylorii]|uniref:RING-type domain-containing protein n=1 Tax=Chrysophaeum taylorii TaxID=2483200 RepID=A0AAD7XQB4_9STRA|nr:hypothetical protein CTAYLR_005671 [Chrysophaeum taylorii]